MTNLGLSSIAIGNLAGYGSTGLTPAGSSIMINAGGAATNATQSQSIVINALSGSNLEPATGTGLFIQPIATTTITQNPLVYDTTTKEVKYTTGKTFVIDHPLDESRYLVHGCLEGPEVGVYYRGQVEVKEKYVEIELPGYVSKFATDLTVYATHEYDEDIDTEPKTYSVSKIRYNKFKIYGSKGRVNWVVFGKREEINTEPKKIEVDVKGEGPYKWI
jgi:hypothetical protein